MQNLLKLIFPPQCASCGALVEAPHGLCGACWRETPFLIGLVCDLCGAPLPGEDGETPEICDDCLTIERPWDRGRAALAYRDTARRLVLALKHGDRLDLVPATVGWLHRAAAPLLSDGPLVVPVPVHWRRRIARRYNQAALLANALARRSGCAVEPRALIRSRATPIQDGLGLDARFANVHGTIGPHPVHGARMAGANVLLVDDVMTSGATLGAAAEAARAAGAASVSVAVLARAVKDA